MTTPDHRPDKHFEQRIRELYHEAARRIDPATAGRLRTARRTALQSAHAPSHRSVRWLIPAGAFAVIALATMMVWQPLSPRRAVPTTMQTVGAFDQAADLDNELPPDADKTDPTLYQNLDFYGWLAASHSHPATR